MATSSIFHNIIIDDPKRADAFVAALVRNTPAHYDAWYRKPGLLKGQIIMSDDFDAPLDDFEDYM